MTDLSPLAELRANVARPFERAFAMPKSVYTSPEFLALEEKHIFSKEWLCAGRADALPEPGDYLTIEITGKPVIVLRDRDGTLRGAPAMAANQAFCKENIHLPAVRVENWLGWIKVTLDPDAPSPHNQLKEVDNLVGHLDMGSYRESFRWNTNWKVLAENFMESYHLPVCHSGTIGGSSDLARMTCRRGPSGRSQGPARRRQCRGQGLHRKGLSRSERGPVAPRPAKPS